MRNELLNNAVRCFHEDEDGMEALQVIMIVAIAAVALALLKTQWQPIKTFFNNNVKEVLEFNGH